MSWFGPVPCIVPHCAFTVTVLSVHTMGKTGPSDFSMTL